MVLEHIRNFVAVTPNLATSGQPSEAQLREVAAAGFEVVINLGLLDPQYCLPNEASLVQVLGMEYHHIPVNFQAPQLDDLHTFFSVMEAAQGKQVFVHCAANKRVSSFVALYGEAKLYWSREQANAVINRIWQPDAVWASFIAQARHDLEKISHG